MNQEDRWRIPGIPPRWQQLLICVLFHLFLPLLPLLIEWWKNSTVTGTSLTMAAAMYAIGIGGSSRNSLMFAVTIVLSIVFSIAFGMSLNAKNSLNGIFALAIGALIAVFVIHFLERYNRHIALGESFWEFN